MIIGASILMRYPLTIRATVHIEDDKQIKLAVIFSDEGVLKSYLDYSVFKRTKSQSWLDASARSICLLLEFTQFNQTYYKRPADLFEAFSEKLFIGTVNEHGEDSSGLRWPIKSIQNANKIISYVTQFSDWLCKRKGLSNRDNLNPWREATSHEERLNWAAYSHKNSSSFLSHTWSDKSAMEQNKQSRNIRYEQDTRGTYDNHAKNRFPDDCADDLIHKGFIKPGNLPTAPAYKRLELRDILITILMHYGGLRVSEPFHLWFGDIQPDPENPDSAYVKIYHPVNGISPTDRTYRCRETRKETLAKNYRMTPRNKYEKSKKIHAGWKNPKLSSSKDNFMVVHWFEPSAGEVFYFYWLLYLKTQWIKPNEKRDHPFVFTNQYGDPYSIDSFVKKHQKAVERIGLVVSKDLGTTDHGHRYAYINRLEEAGIGPVFIGNAAHHKSIKSHKGYLSKPPSEIRKELKRLEDKVKNTLLAEKDNG